MTFGYTVSGFGASDSWDFQGSHFGYSLGGDGSANNIEKFTFASAGNASNVADLTRSVNSIAGTCARDHGYSAVI